MGLDQDALVEKINSIEWYHTIELAKGVFTPGRFDPRPMLGELSFPADLSGKSVLDIGAYDGFFTFEAERRGAARVVAMDRHPAIHKGFAIAHEALSSNAEYVQGSVYDLSPETHGTFDVVIFFGVLYHLRHPILALDRIHSVCRDYALVESAVLDEWFVHEGKAQPLERIDAILKQSAVMQFYPGDELNADWSNWWAPNIECLRLMLETSGFRAEFSGHWGNRAAFKANRLEFDQPNWY